MMKPEIEAGNFNAEEATRGWRVGHFVERPNFRTDQTEFQWASELQPGTAKATAAYNKQSSTLVVLIDGEMRVDFPHTKAESVTLSNRGDYVFFAPGVCHAWEALQKTTVVSVRWPSIPDDQVPCDHADY